MTPKFKRGFRVEIKSKLDDSCIGYEVPDNYGVGYEAIIISHNPHPEQAGIIINPTYEILILFSDDYAQRAYWYKENDLKLICSNEEKGEKILIENGCHPLDIAPEW